MSDEEEEDIYANENPGTSGLKTKLKNDGYVAACYGKNWYIAQILGTNEIRDENGFAIYFKQKFTEIKGKNKFAWPLNEDIINIIS